MEEDDPERKLASYSFGYSSKVFVDYGEEMTVESIRFSLKLLSDADMLRLKEEAMDEDSSSRDNGIITGTGGEVNRISQLSDKSMKTKEKSKIDAGDDRGSEAKKKKRKKVKEKYEELQKEDGVAKLMDTSVDNTKILRDMSVDVSHSPYAATHVKADSGSGMFVRWLSSELLKLFQTIISWWVALLHMQTVY
jgi:hypothetical protein